MSNVVLKVQCICPVCGRQGSVTSEVDEAILAIAAPTPEQRAAFLAVERYKTGDELRRLVKEDHDRWCPAEAA